MTKREVELTVDPLPLLVQPAARDFVSPLEHHVVALQAVGKVVPRRRDHGVLALQVLDDLFTGRLRVWTCTLGALSDFSENSKRAWHGEVQRRNEVHVLHERR